MCGRLNITSDPLTQLLMEAFGIAATPANNHNLAPTESVLVVRATSGDEDVSIARGAAGFSAADMRWWLTPSWAKSPDTRYAMFNARAETLAEKRAFARPFRSQRCVVPVTGYYEWKKHQRQKLPFYIHARDDGGLLLAALWDRWTDGKTGEVLESCSIVTAAAHSSMAFLHHRQPVFLTLPEAREWLDGEATLEELGVLLEPHLPGELQIDPVSTFVNNARNNGPRCTQPIAEAIVADPAAALTEEAMTRLLERDSEPQDLPQRGSGNLFDVDN